jgi:flavin reductase (DIM6/NTAB) family NADH-FMN oxidoreductase RutF
VDGAVDLAEFAVLEAAAAFTQRELRDGLGAFASGVTIVTAVGPRGPVGLTVSAFASVSLDPPLVLVCLDKRAGSLPAFEAADSFAVNVLGADQQALAAHYACRGSERFGEAGWSLSPRDLPVLDEALAVIECRRHAVHDGGDHRIFVGRAVSLRRTEADPLLVFGGRYRTIEGGC